MKLDQLRPSLSLRAVVLAGAVVLSVEALAQGAPRELQNRTVEISFNITVPARTGDGGTLNAVRATVYRIYISSAGRIFVREHRLSGRHQDTVDKGPESRGDSGSFSFSGASLVGTVQHISGARRVTVNFGSGFQGCSASVIIGKESQKAVVWKGVNGVTYTSTGPGTFSTPSCSIREGNLLGS
jgi:hypothetical protein